MTPQEKLNFQNALALISHKYGHYIIGNLNVLTLMAKPQVLVKFMDSVAFHKNLLFTDKPRVGCTVNGFTSHLSDPPVIYINRDSATPATIIHELLHYLTSKAFTQSFPPEIIEGTTEYFTRKVIGRAATLRPKFEQFIVDRAGIYDTEHDDVNVARGLIKSYKEKVDRADYMKRAYFKGYSAAIELFKQTVG